MSRVMVAAMAVILVCGPASAAGADSLGLSATYDVSARLSYRYARLRVDSLARVTNPTSQPVAQLVFNLVPLVVGDATIESVTVNGQPASSVVEDQSVYVDLPTPLVGGQAAVRIVYRASLLPSPLDGNGYFVKADGIVSAARWIPWLSRPASFSRPNFGNPYVTATASRVDVRLTSERRLIYATSGQRRALSADGLTQTFVARSVRDFNFAAAPNYLQASMQVGGVVVRLFYRDLPAARVMSWARRAVEYYLAKVGAYPWPTLTIAETGTQKGLESPAHVWIPRSTAWGRLPYLVAHEIAHQWFYGVVGSDQPAEPFADEAVADLLARLVTSTLRRSTCPIDSLDRSIYEYADACYFETIYVQGGRYLNDYRLAVGDQLFWAGIQRYYAEHRLKLGGTRALLTALDTVSGRDGSAHAARFPRLYGAP
jgi:hypothetical protein